ncbi:hypothetical protein KKA53_05395 [Candidatus Dependentiae bacterium]|nr:hypothetical protein [Candidatus Dependentiae bacterium]
MKVENIAFQGDLMVRRVDRIPAEAKPVVAVAGRYIVAHSETGHHHTVTATGCEMHEASEFLAYLALATPATIVHERSFDTHEPLYLDEGIWEIRRQREWTPEGERRAAD